MHDLDTIRRLNREAAAKALRERTRADARATLSEFQGPLLDSLLASLDDLSTTGYLALDRCGMCGLPLAPGSGCEVSGMPRCLECLPR